MYSNEITNGETPSFSVYCPIFPTLAIPPIDYACFLNFTPIIQIGDVSRSTFSSLCFLCHKSAGKVNPNGYAATIGLEKYLQTASIDQKLKELIKIRASQINGCAFCIDKHTKDARKMGETEQRIYALNAWRETPFFTPEERAVLALTEGVTLITEGHVPDEVYSEVRRYFDETQTAELIMAIVTINAWNRIAISTRKMPPVEQE